jgi:hypothetical protein
LLPEFQKALEQMGENIKLARKRRNLTTMQVAERILNKGFRLIACPAVAWCAWGPRVGKWQFKNINAYAEVYGKINHPNNLGIIHSKWVPSRYLQNSQWDTYAVAAEIGKNKGNYSAY